MDLRFWSSNVSISRRRFNIRNRLPTRPPPSTIGHRTTSSGTTHTICRRSVSCLYLRWMRPQAKAAPIWVRRLRANSRTATPARSGLAAHPNTEVQRTTATDVRACTQLACRAHAARATHCKWDHGDVSIEHDGGKRDLLDVVGPRRSRVDAQLLQVCKVGRQVPRRGGDEHQRGGYPERAVSGQRGA